MLTVMCDTETTLVMEQTTVPAWNRVAELILAPARQMPARLTG
jgi:hypothetical protein